MKRLDIVLPAYHPKGKWWERLETMLQNFMQRYEHEGLRIRVIVSPDGSWQHYDATMRAGLAALEEQVPIVVVGSNQNRGKGFAVRAGVLVAEADYILYTDYDFPFEEEGYYRVLDTLFAGADVVVGGRGNDYLRHLPLFRRFLSKASRWVNQLLFWLPCNEAQSGVKGLNKTGREALLDTTIRSFLFDTEFIARATRLGLRIEEVETKVRPDVVLSSMGWRVLWRELRGLPQVLWVRWFSGKKV